MPEHYPIILVVDDDPLNLEILQGMIECMSSDIQCDTASSGANALTLIEIRLKEVIAGNAPMYKAILMDYSMPEMDGPCSSIAIRKLLKDHAARKDLSQSIKAQLSPFIACCTSYHEDEYVKRVYDSGMDHFMNKPVNYYQLEQIIQTHCQ